MNLAIIIGVLFGFLIIGLSSYLFYIMYYKKEEKPSHDLIIWNRYLSHMTGGYKEGIGKVSKGVTRDCVHFTPRDIKWINYFSDGKYADYTPPTFKLWIPREKLNYFHSDHREFVEILPLSVDEIDKELAKTTEGKILMQKISDQNVDISEKDFIRNELEKIKEFIGKEWIGELTAEIVDKRVRDEALKVAMEEKKEKEEK